MVHNLSRMNLENIVNSIVLYIRKVLPSGPKPTERTRDRIGHCWNDYKLLRQKYLTAYRSIPHNTTGKNPTELLFNRKVKGKIADLSIDHAYDHEVHDRDAEQKANSKAYADIHRRASPSSIELGDEVLVQQDTTNILSTAFNPNPFKVVGNTGNSLVVESPAENQYSRNTSNVKHYIREGDPTPQQGSDSVSTPPHPSRN